MFLAFIKTRDFLCQMYSHLVEISPGTTTFSQIVPKISLKNNFYCFVFSPYLKVSNITLCFKTRSDMAQAMAYLEIYRW